MVLAPRHKTVQVPVGRFKVGGDAPVVVQSMTNTDTADAVGTAKQIIELANAGSELVRITVNVPEAAATVAEIKQRVNDAGIDVPIIGDFHYNGHELLTEYPDCARGARQIPHQSRQRRRGKSPRRAVFDDLQSRRRQQQAGAHRRQRRLAESRTRDATRCRRTPTRDLGQRLRRNHQRLHGASRRCRSTELALECGLRKDQIIISCKISKPRPSDLAVSRISRSRPTSRCIWV